MYILVVSLCTFMGWDSTVGVAACYSLDDLTTPPPPPPCRYTSEFAANMMSDLDST